MFVDYVKIIAKAGDGGNGAITFHREKYIDNGGPDGGDGGRGGSLYFIADKGINTLLNFRFRKKVEAESGEKGSKKNSTGKSADDIFVPVPIGTVVRDLKTGKIICDLSEDLQEFMIAKGGQGGKGNQHFANSIRQSPRFAELGAKGEEKELELELKLIADVGLIGYPNVGKSTIISCVSEARPKIANYHFTTLEPMLGVVRSKSGQTFVMADIPGIIEGASDGVGLGLKFLRHVERTRLLLHVIDVSGSEGRTPLEDYNKINEELKNFSEKLALKKQIIVGNKTDISVDEKELKKLEKAVKKDGRILILISAVTNKNLDELVNTIEDELAKLPKEDLVPKEEMYERITLNSEDREYDVKKVGDEFFVSGSRIEGLMRRVNIDDLESRQYMQRVLIKMGIMSELRRMGIKEGQNVDILGFKLEWED